MSGSNILALDLGTTHCKAGLFTLDGVALKLAARPMAVQRGPSGEAWFEPEALWGTVCALVREATASAGPVAAVGIASMAETGLLVDRRTGAPRSPLIPWFDTTSQPQADLIRRGSDPLERFLKTGRRASFKCSLAKILSLREKDPGSLPGAFWLLASDYVAYKLTGQFGSDPSLAASTFAYRMDRRAWDVDWLREWKLSPALFPPVNPSGSAVGGVQAGAAALLGLQAGIPVAVCGHDHAVAAFGMQVLSPGRVLDSMGTAESLVGALPAGPLTAEDFRSGLLYGPHVAQGSHFWLGGLSASGGSVEWLRAQLGSEPLSYAEIESLLAEAGPEPTGILYFPYLLGSSSPHTDPRVRGALVGLSASHGRADLLKAVLEGTAYEVEFIRQTGERASGHPIPVLAAAGGGTRNQAWLQIKADVSGCRIEASAEPEATLLGAALLAGIGAGLYASEAEALAGLRLNPPEVFLPDEERHATYRRLYEQGYLSFQDSLRKYFNQ